MKRNKSGSVTLTENDFRDISTDVAAEICQKLECAPNAILLSALLCAEISKRIFDNELIIEER
jgi:hypothetical protein